MFVPICAILLFFYQFCILHISAFPNKDLRLELDVHWHNFKATYNKEYDRQLEYVRRIIWESNVQFIQKHNLEYDMGKHSYALGVNEFADLTTEEYHAYLLGRRQKKRTNITSSMYMSPLNVQQLPQEVDWREKGFVTPVKNQGQCGSCWAFSSTGALEGQYYRKNKKLMSFSEQQLVDCSKDYGNLGCNGGLMDNAFKYIKERGIMAEDEYPYLGRGQHCRYNSNKIVTKVTGLVDIPPGNEEALQDAVANVGPISVAIDASQRTFQFYKHGVYNEGRCSNENLDHGVLVVGYGVDNGEHYWLVKNSWGPEWGIDGYVKMSRNKDNQCGIASSASYPQI